MKDNHTWVICAYGESEYLEACIQSLKDQTLQSQIICYSSTPLKSIIINIPSFQATPN